MDVDRDALISMRGATVALHELNLRKYILMSRYLPLWLIGAGSCPIERSTGRVSFQQGEFMVINSFRRRA